MKRLLNFKADESLIKKLKYISWYDRQTITETCVTASADYIKGWEKKNGKITEDQLANAKLQ